MQELEFDYNGIKDINDKIAKYSNKLDYIAVKKSVVVKKSGFSS